MLKLKLLLGFIILISLEINAQPALPEQGYRWVLNEELSDEFDGTSLNTDKWKNTDPSRWIGRAPGLFMKESVSVGDGDMRITTDMLAEPQVINGNTFTHQGGHVISQKRVKPGSFIECRMKANKTFMSSTFWLINYSNENSGCDKRTTELDIQECIGYPASKIQTQRMGSNTHSRNVPVACTQVASGSKGDHIETNGKVYDDYYTYGAWWKNSEEIVFFLNGQQVYTIKPYAEFNLEMYIKLVCETYNWSPVPADGGMTGSWEERTTFYDWVRTYTYLPVDETNNSTGNIFQEEVQFTNKPSSKVGNDLNFVVNYKANTERTMVLELIDSQGNVVSDSVKVVYAGYGNLSIGVESLSADGDYKAVVSIYNTSDDSLVATDSFNLSINSVSTSVEVSTGEGIYLKPNPVSKYLSVVGLKSPFYYEIFTMNSNQIVGRQTKTSNANIDVSYLVPGTYIICLKSERSTNSFKFVKN